MGSYLRLAAVALVGVVLAGCVEAPSVPAGKVRTDAPEIKGVDSAGNELKLSDYRGKVVLVDFWFDQCGPCRQNHTDEKPLMVKYKNRPFIILGVNTDKKLETMVQSEKEQKMTWPSIWDGNGFRNSQLYGIDAVPTMFLIDYQGRQVQRINGLPYSQKDRKQLDNAIEKLVQEAEQAAATTATQ